MEQEKRQRRVQRERRLRHKVAKLGALPAAEIARRVSDSAMTFTSDGARKDDLTLIVVKRAR